MSLVFYNTLTHKKEEFVPLNPPEVKIYSCGPTVYDHPHLGNYRAYVFVDLLRRYLKYRGFKPMHIMNITDVEDKIIKRSREENIHYKEITNKFTKAFFQEMKMLNIEEVEFYPRATEHIKEMVDMIKKLLQNEYAYRGEDGSIYFKIDKFKDYGKLSKINRDELIPGARISQDEYTKEKAYDFALWKAYSPEDGLVFWDTELGKGRPGWHIECSAMSTKYLGVPLDIHTGGVDLIFPHHENEIAQSEAANSKKFVNFWLHNEHLLVDGQKMSKSLGNFYTLRDILEKNLPLMALRYFFVSNHYRSKLNFTFPVFDANLKTLENICDFVKRISLIKTQGPHENKIENLLKELKFEFEKYMDDDLNSPRAISAIFTFIKETNKIITDEKIYLDDAEKILHLFSLLDEVLGLGLKEIILREKDTLTEEEKTLIEERERARKNHDWKKSDEIRETLKKHGIYLEDRKAQPVQIIIKKLEGEEPLNK